LKISAVANFMAATAPAFAREPAKDVFGPVRRGFQVAARFFLAHLTLTRSAGAGAAAAMLT